MKSMNQKCFLKNLLDNGLKFVIFPSEKILDNIVAGIDGLIHCMSESPKGFIHPKAINIVKNQSSHSFDEKEINLLNRQP